MTDIKNKYIQISRIQGNTKKRVITVSMLIFSILLGLTSAFLWISYEASMLGSDKDINWEAEVGDKFYLAFRDKYTWTDKDLEEDEKVIRDFQSILKSEILKVEDLDIDLDNDDDLMIMSSFLLGREDLFSIEIPNYFDLYNILLLGYDLMSILETDSYFNETAKLFYPTMPSAIHYVSSGVHHELSQLVEDMNLGHLVESEFPVFEDISDLYYWFINNAQRLALWNESFTNYEGLGNIGYDINDDYGRPKGIDYWDYKTNFPDNNSASLFNRFDGDWGIIMNQDNDTQAIGKDDLTINVDIFDAWLNNTEFGNEVILSNYFFKPSLFSFNLDLNQRLTNPDENSTNSHILEVGIVGSPFNITGKINEYDYDFEGYNGLQLRFNNGILQYHCGNYTYDTTVPFSHYWRPSNISEKGWKTVSGASSYNFTEIFGENSVFGELMNVEITPTFDTYSGLETIFGLFGLFGYGVAGDKYSYNIKITDTGEGISNFDKTFENIPLHIDCPFDFLNAKYNDLDIEDSFRWENMSRMYFSMYNTTDDYSSKDYFDDILLNGFVYDKDTHFFSLMDAFIYTNLFLLSFYHSLFYPTDFDWDIIYSVANLINEFMELFTGIVDFFDIKEDSNSLEIKIQNEGIQDLVDILIVLVMEMIGYDVNYEWINGMEGEVEFDMILKFDKRINALNDSYIKINYKDLGMERELGMSLVAVADKDGNAKYDTFYPAYPEDQLSAQFESIVSQSIIGIIIASIVSVSSSVGIVELIHYLRKRKGRT